jgi:hypothetical protein
LALYEDISADSTRTPKVTVPIAFHFSQQGLNLHRLSRWTTRAFIWG